MLSDSLGWIKKMIKNQQKAWSKLTLKKKQETKTNKKQKDLNKKTKTIDYSRFTLVKANKMLNISPKHEQRARKLKAIKWMKNIENKVATETKVTTKGKKRERENEKSMDSGV